MFLHKVITSAACTFVFVCSHQQLRFRGHQFLATTDNCPHQISCCLAGIIHISTYHFCFFWMTGWSEISQPVIHKCTCIHLIYWPCTSNTWKHPSTSFYHLLDHRQKQPNYEIYASVYEYAKDCSDLHMLISFYVSSCHKSWKLKIIKSDVSCPSWREAARLVGTAS